MCWPQPAQVGLPQFLQVTRRHMVGSLSRRWVSFDRGRLVPVE